MLLSAVIRKFFCDFCALCGLCILIHPTIKPMDFFVLRIFRTDASMSDFGISPFSTAERMLWCASPKFCGIRSISHPAKTARYAAAAEEYSFVIDFMDSESVIITPEKESSPRSHFSTTCQLWVLELLLYKLFHFAHSPIN